MPHAKESRHLPSSLCCCLIIFVSLVSFDDVVLPEEICRLTRSRLSGTAALEEDAQILKVIEAYCTSAKTRQTLNSSEIIHTETHTHPRAAVLLTSVAHYVSPNMFLLLSFYASLPSSPLHFLHLMCFFIIYCIHVLVTHIILFFFLSLHSFNPSVIYPKNTPNFCWLWLKSHFYFYYYFIFVNETPPTSTLRLVRTSYPSFNMVFTPHRPHPDAVSNPHPRLVTLWFSLARDWPHAQPRARRHRPHFGCSAREPALLWTVRGLGLWQYLDRH